MNRIVSFGGSVSLALALTSSGFLFSEGAGAVTVTPMVVNECVVIGGNNICGNPSWIAAAEAAYVTEQADLAKSESANQAAINDYNAEQTQENITEGELSVVKTAQAAYNTAVSAKAKASDLTALENATNNYDADVALENALQNSYDVAENVAETATNLLDVAESVFAAF